MYRIFVINPGSTSTKIALFEDDRKVYEKNVFHDSGELLKLGSVNDQLPYRKELIRKCIDESGLDLTGIDAIVGRGGAAKPCAGGVYEVDDRYLYDVIHPESVDHPSNLGAQLAKEFQKLYGGRVFVVDPPVTDEFEDIARITGIRGIYRYSHLHALNLKATARVHCEKNHIRYEDGCFIVCHIDGGMSISAHRYGKMIDGTDAAGGEGPFTPTRAGAIDCLDLCDYLKDKDPAEVKKTAGRAGGLSDHFGTSNADKIHQIVEAGDADAQLIWNAMIYNICKSIGAMAAVLEGRVDAIICGGGLLRFEDICQGIRNRCEWIAPVFFYPGEYEHEAMAAGAIRVLKGEEQLQVYTGEGIELCLQPGKK